MYGMYGVVGECNDKILECKNGDEKPARSIVGNSRTTIYSSNSNWNHNSVRLWHRDITLRRNASCKEDKNIRGISLPQLKCLTDFLELDQKAGQGNISLPHS